MTDKKFLSEQRIVDCLQTHFGILVSELIPLSLGADANALVYKVQAGTISYFLKLKRDHHHEVSTEIITFLQSAGIQQIIPPIKTTTGQPTFQIDKVTLLLYPFIDGQDGFIRDLTDEQWLTLGKTLKRIHTIAIPPSIQHYIRREKYASKWRDFVVELYNSIDTIQESDDISLKLLAVMKDKKSLILQLVTRAEQLGTLLQQQSTPFVLCHSDIHGGNVLISQNDAIYIVDWDEPIMAPKERDLMFVGGGVGNVWNKPGQVASFYQGYGEGKVNMTVLSYYRYERIVEDIAEYAQALLMTAEGGKDRSTMFKQFMSMFEPQGVVDIAFKN